MQIGKLSDEGRIMTSKVPTQVVLYRFVREGDPVRTAEFAYSPEGGISLVVHNVELGGGIAQEYYDRGVPDDRERRVVTRDEPEVFMRTLLQPRNSTFYRWVDESDTESDGSRSPT